MSTMDKVYTDGFFGKQAETERQREFIVSRCSIHVEDFKKFLDRTKEHVNDKGYMQFDIKKSMKDPKRFYGEVNTYKPQNGDKVTAKDHSPDRDSSADLPF